MTRPSFALYFGKMAVLASERATCPRASVGAVLVRDNHMLSMGYNGAPSGLPECTQVGCAMIDQHCVRSIHSETNAVGDAARRGISVEGAQLFYYDSEDREPCQGCLLVMLSASITIISRVDIYGYTVASWFTKELFSSRLIPGFTQEDNLRSV